jgi:hypothetical protein
MRYALVTAAFLLHGCALSTSGEKGEPCVEQPRCVIFCTVNNNQCKVKGEKDDGAG